MTVTEPAPTEPAPTEPAPTEPDQQGEEWEGMSTRTLLLTISGVLALMVVVVCAAVMILSEQVHGHSMQPTLKEGDRFLTMPGTVGNPNRLDVVVLTEPQSGNLMVKRVIGLPGDKIRIMDVGGQPQLFIKPHEDRDWYTLTSPAWDGHLTEPLECCLKDGRAGNPAAIQTIPDGQVFVMGDNPDGSTDSRKFGFRPAADVQARVLWRVWPLSELGSLPNEPTFHLAKAPAK